MLGAADEEDATEDATAAAAAAAEEAELQGRRHTHTHRPPNDSNRCATWLAELVRRRRSRCNQQRSLTGISQEEADGENIKLASSSIYIIDVSSALLKDAAGT